MWREIKKISQQINKLYKEGVYDPMRPESLEFTYDELTKFNTDNERDTMYIDPSELGGIGGHYADEQMYHLDDEDCEED